MAIEYSENTHPDYSARLLSGVLRCGELSSRLAIIRFNTRSAIRIGMICALHLGLVFLYTTSNILFIYTDRIIMMYALLYEYDYTHPPRALGFPVQQST